MRNAISSLATVMPRRVPQQKGNRGNLDPKYPQAASYFGSQTLRDAPKPPSPVGPPGAASPPDAPISARAVAAASPAPTSRKMPRNDEHHWPAASSRANLPPDSEIEGPATEAVRPRPFSLFVSHPSGRPPHPGCGPLSCEIWKQSLPCPYTVARVFSEPAYWPGELRRVKSR